MSGPTSLSSRITWSPVSSFSAAPAESQVGKWLKIDGRDEYFRILSHTAATTAFTIDTPYTETTSAGLVFKIIQTDYTLTAPSEFPGGILRLAGAFDVHRRQTGDSDDEGKIHVIDAITLKKMWPIHCIREGIPTRAAVMIESDGVLTVRFNMYVDELTRVEVPYIPVPATLDKSGGNPILPFNFRDGLVFIAAAWLCPEKNDDRAADYLDKGKAILMSMVKAKKKTLTHTSKHFGRLIPRLDNLGRK